MKVILLQDVKGTGKKGDIVEVKDGYCRNFLMPKKLVAPANKANISLLEREQKQIAEIRQKELENARQISDKINGHDFLIEVKSGENGKLFGSVTNKEVATAIENTVGIQVDKKKIVLEEPLKTTGSHEVQVKIHPEVETKINVILKPL